MYSDELAPGDVFRAKPIVSTNPEELCVYVCLWNYIDISTKDHHLGVIMMKAGRTYYQPCGKILDTVNHDARRWHFSVERL